MDRVTFPIDVVYTWVDGDDPRLADRESAARDERRGLHDGARDDPASPTATNCAHSLRSLDMFAPWVRHVFLVTDDQVPAWLDTAHRG